MSTKEEQITERAKKHRNEALTNLNQFIDLELLDESFHKLNKKSRGGVDGIVWEQYEPRLSSRLPELLGDTLIQKRPGQSSCNPSSLYPERNKG